MLRIHRQPPLHRERNDGGGSEGPACRDRGGRSGRLRLGIEAVRCREVRGESTRPGGRPGPEPFVDRGPGVV